MAGRGPPIAGPFVARLPGTRPLLPAAVPAASPPPRPVADPRQLSPHPGLASPLSSTQKLQARRLLSTAPIFPPTTAGARARGPHRRPAARGRASEEPGRPPQRRVCTLMLSAAGRRKKRAHVRALARRSSPGSRDASACPHAAASSRGAPRPPRGASFSLFLSLRRRDPPRGRRRLPARPTPLPSAPRPDPGSRGRRARPLPAEPPARWASRAPAGRRGKVFPRRIPMGFFPRAAEGVRRRRPTLGPAWSGLLSASRPVAARAALCAPGRGARWSCWTPGCAPCVGNRKVPVRLALARSGEPGERCAEADVKQMSSGLS